MLIKNEYQALLTLLDRVETRGTTEARSLLILEQKLQARIANWFDGHVTGFKQDIAPTQSEIAVTSDHQTGGITAAAITG